MINFIGGILIGVIGVEVFVNGNGGPLMGIFIFIGFIWLVGIMVGGEG